MVSEPIDRARRAAERVARQSHGRLVALLAARTGDVAGAEDALADAFAAALTQWPLDGVPRNPEAWLMTVAHRRQLDAIRRASTRNAGLAHLRLIGEEIEAALQTPNDIPDERLSLMFACAHPAIDPGMRAPLILQTVLGLTAEDIASAFLVPAATMSQRLVRAKSTIKSNGIAFRVPDAGELPGRLDAVLDAVYSAYTKAWGEDGGPATPELADEAIWLGRLLGELLPDAPEVKGMLALMLYAEARRPARRGPSAAYVPLSDQDTALWNLSMIEEAEALMHAASAAGPSGRYQIEAAIQSAHIAGRLTRSDTREAILALYEHLAVLVPSPVVALNCAVAKAEVAGPDAALLDIEPLRSDKRLSAYQPFWAAYGHLNARAGRIERAHEAFTRAIGLTVDPAVRTYLEDQRRKLAQG